MSKGFKMEIKTSLLQVCGDERGSLIAIEEEKNIPFKIKRVYYIFNTQEGVSRGFHAHQNLNQMVIAVRGTCRFILDDGIERREVILGDPAEGLFIGPLIWREMHDFSDDCVLMILADKLYDDSDYIRNYVDFLKISSHIRKHPQEQTFIS